MSLDDSCNSLWVEKPVRTAFTLRGKWLYFVLEKRNWDDVIGIVQSKKDYWLGKDSQLFSIFLPSKQKEMARNGSRRELG